MPKTLFRTRSALLAALIGFTGACGDGAAATVNGVDISVSQVETMRISEEATLDKVAFAEDLTNAIVNLAIVTAARDEFSIDPTIEEINEKKENLASEFEAAQGISVEDYFATESLPMERFDDFARIQVIRDQLFTAFEDDPSLVPATDADARLLGIPACVRHILVPSEAEADAARTRIEAGEDFAAVASDVGTDGTAPSGGDLGCQRLGRYVIGFADAVVAAEIGVVTGPIETEFGWHLILVESRQDMSLEELREEVDAGRISQLVEEWLFEAATDATVEVDPQYGVWVTEPNPMVQAPSS